MVSNAPWSNYKESDYSLEQWHAACLIHQHVGAPTSKSQCKLPVKTPNGVLNRNGVHAAATALAGARADLKASPSEKEQARVALVRFYKQFDEEAPQSLSHANRERGTRMANTTAAIMAIPGPLEKIRLIGDEEKHATLLFFGETSTLPDNAKQTLLDGLEQASEMLFPFSETVKDVSRLGNDIPPALVAMLSGDNLVQVRNLFMMNSEINGYQENVTQFPSYMPHVTLGYPDYKDEVVLRVLAKSIYRVQFNRLALWWNDERIEFPFGLGPSDDLTMGHAIEDFLKEYAESDEVLAHYGIKGQRWGIRRRVDSSTGLVARTDSEDAIKTARIAKKLQGGGVAALSNSDLKSFSERIRLEQEFNRSVESAAAQRGGNFVTRFLAKQGKRQFNRVADRAIDIAIEQAILMSAKQAGKAGKKELDSVLRDLGVRLQPKKKK